MKFQAENDWVRTIGTVLILGLLAAAIGAMLLAK